MTTELGRRTRTALARFVLAAAATGGVAHFSAQLPVRTPGVGDEAFVPEPAVAKLLAFGFDAPFADLQWMRAVQIVGSDAGPIGRNRTLGALIDVVTTLDPHVDHPYRFAAVWLTDDETAVRKANELLRRGIAHHPDDWRNYFYLSFNLFFYFDEQEEAAAALKPALRLAGAPPYLRRLAARLESRAGGLDAAAAFLAELMQQSQDPAERKAFLGSLREIETERRARLLDAARAEYVERKHHDIRTVDDLVAAGVLRELPPDPFGAGWEISAETGEIVSKHVRYRYGVKIDKTNRIMLEAFRQRSRSAKGE